MKCNIDHSEPNAMPSFLCRTCNPALTNAPTEDRTAVQDERALAQGERYARKQKRRLRAEVKTWRNRVEIMRRHNVHPQDIAKAEATLRKAEHDLYLVA